MSIFRRFRVVAFLAAAVPLAVLAACLVTQDWRPEDAVAAKLASELTSAPDEDALPHMRRLALLGEPGLAAIVPLVDSRRPPVAVAARTVLLAELESWRHVPLDRSTPRAAFLARRLATDVEKMRPPARRFAARLAERILRWPQSADPDTRFQLVADCHAVLLAAGPAVDDGGEPWPPQGSGGPFGPEQGSIARGGAIVGRSAAAPDGDDANTAELPPFVSPSEGAPSPPRANAPFAVSDNASPGDPPAKASVGDGGPEALPNASAGVPSPPKKLDPPPARRLVPSLVPIDPGSEPANSAVDVPLPLARLDDLALMHELHSPFADRGEGARQELKRRGFDDTARALADRLAHPDSGVRLKLAEDLARIPNVDAVPWLLALSRDPDRGVRIAVMRIMATSASPELVRRIAQMEREDADTAVRLEARQIMDRRRR
jgi:hypothetical protein